MNLNLEHEFKMLLVKDSKQIDAIQIFCVNKPLYLLFFRKWPLEIGPQKWSSKNGSPKMAHENCRYKIAMKISVFSSESKQPFSMIFLTNMAYNFDYDGHFSSKMVVLNGIPIRLARIFFPRHETGIFSVVSDELVL